MTLSLLGLLLLAAFVVTIAHAINRAPLWPAVLLMIVVEAIAVGVARL